ncbi:hypothetical protein CDL15_Pgr028928 [Punica granatum]|uniref:Transcription factor TT2-like n=1 Tax=Punica granatum TaxID=22663 RepID=A0A218WYK6_PUNGR|nr:hypothetical protein CDL15_Pgr028928 [Punica granatum]
MRRPCCAKEGLNRGAWSAEEDEILTYYIKSHGEGQWRDLPQRAGLKRCGKSCRLRWVNYLRPYIKRGNICEEEEELILRMHKLLGNRWALIAARLPGRTDNEIKNYWNTNLRKRVRDRDRQKFGMQTDNESGQGRLRIANSIVSGEAHRVIRTKAVRCTKVLFQPQPLEKEQSHAMLSDVPLTDSGNPLSSSHYPNDKNIDFLVDFGIDDLLAPDIDLLMSSYSMVHADKGIINEHKDVTHVNFPAEESPCAPMGCARRFVVGGEHFDLNGEIDFNALSSLLGEGCDDEIFAY